MALTREQQHVLNTILRVAGQVRASPKQRLAAVETGIVETNLRNLGYGDGSSLGWRQETASSYPGVNRRDVAAAARRFFSESAPLRGKYGTAGALAQAVQRSAYPGRYQAVRGQALSLLKGAGGGVDANGAAPSAPAVSPLTPGAAAGTGTETLLAALANQRPAIQATAPAPPAGAAGPTLPGGYTPPASSGAPQPKADVASLLAAAQPDTASAAPTAAPAAQPAITQTGSSPDRVRQIFERAVKLNGAQLPYKWGGGHGGRVNVNKPIPLDCSGAVSAVLGIDPRVSGQFEGWGQAGRGKSVTIYANGHHVLMEINGHFFGTSRTNPGGGAGWIPRGAISSQYLKGFTVRHPAGL